MDPGLTAALEFPVTEHDTAEALLSGDLPVLGTPRLLAWLEAATCAAIKDRLPAEQTSVGTRADVEHRAASGVGAVVIAWATLTHVDGRVLQFEVGATDQHTGTSSGTDTFPGSSSIASGSLSPSPDERGRWRPAGLVRPVGGPLPAPLYCVLG